LRILGANQVSFGDEEFSAELLHVVEDGSASLSGRARYPRMLGAFRAGRIRTPEGSYRRHSRRSPRALFQKPPQDRTLLNHMHVETGTNAPLPRELVVAIHYEMSPLVVDHPRTA